MSRFRQSATDDTGESGIDISPLLDCVLILLIFFIVTTVFVQEPGVEVEREFAMSALDLEKNSILMAITPDGEVVYAGSNIGIVGVRAVVKRLTADNETMPIILQVDRAAPAGTVIRVIDECKLANPPSTVSISTQSL